MFLRRKHFFVPSFIFHHNWCSHWDRTGALSWFSKSFSIEQKLLRFSSIVLGYWISIVNWLSFRSNVARLWVSCAGNIHHATRCFSATLNLSAGRLPFLKRSVHFLKERNLGKYLNTCNSLKDAVFARQVVDANGLNPIWSNQRVMDEAIHSYIGSTCRVIIFRVYKQATLFRCRT